MYDIVVVELHIQFHPLTNSSSFSSLCSLANQPLLCLFFFLLVFFYGGGGGSGDLCMSDVYIIMISHLSIWITNNISLTPTSSSPLFSFPSASSTDDGRIRFMQIGTLPFCDPLLPTIVSPSPSDWERITSISTSLWSKWEKIEWNNLCFYIYEIDYQLPPCNKIELAHIDI